MNLASIAEQIRGCTLCPLCRSRHLAVPGEGHPKARLMLIGEAPGKDEDIQGRPFVGRAGQLLDEMLAETGLARNNLFITNLVKCRPPGNRIPHAAEVETCVNTYLTRQIELIQPRVIGLLGNTATRRIIGERVRAIRAKPVSRNDGLFFATYHPAAILRNPSWRKTYLNDFKKLAELAQRG